MPWAASAPPPRAATGELAKLVEDKNSRVAHEAIIALGDIGPGAKDAVPALAKALEQPDDRDMNFAAIAFALGKIGPGAASAESALLKQLESKDDNVRLLERLGPGPDRSGLGRRCGEGRACVDRRPGTAGAGRSPLVRRGPGQFRPVGQECGRSPEEGLDRREQGRSGGGRQGLEGRRASGRRAAARQSRAAPTRRDR